MNERDFVYWIQGFLELTGATSLDEAQVAQIKEHIKLVLTKKTSTIPPQSRIFPNHSTKYC